MASRHDSDRGVSDDVEVQSHRSKRLATDVQSVEVCNVVADDFTEEENRVLVRRMDWHVSAETSLHASQAHLY